ncbi:AAC(3) family N-acetyltransferase [Planotetraspora thailandica]|uniref:Aminoglycoside N(3)-acetyltransferase n=1 Tax=Planotetraspora thailandica TaxID=487172 RepID=A0A8J3UZA5_9ACTN|nr:AAC(3) family N-acetyltransferase [Planotetraspora thailandica]GII54613.1 AAC(3) family N-acetyltransferase [Planotetraspora thailandica]
MFGLPVRLLRPLVVMLVFPLAWSAAPRLGWPRLWQRRLGGKSRAAGAAPPLEAFSQETLTHSLRELGLGPGEVVLVHASLRRVGAMADGVATLVAALREAVGEEGTIVVPTFTSWNSDTSRIYRARVSGMGRIRGRLYRWTIPAYEAATSSSIECGRLSEHVRLLPGAVRSDHPQTSFAAVGPQARRLMADHMLESHLGEESPLAKLFDAKAKVLLLGVGFDKCTGFHLAEYRYDPRPPAAEYGCAMRIDGRRTWRRYNDVVLDDSDFHKCGRDMEQAVFMEYGQVGNAESRLFSLVEAVQHAEGWMRNHRRHPRT